MNAPHPLTALTQVRSVLAPAESNTKEAHFADYLGILVESGWLIGTITVLMLAVGIGYATFTKPVYEANLLIQVEDSSGSAGSILGAASGFFDVKTPAAGEIEIIRSRMVIGQAAEATKFHIHAEPRYLPIVGNWLARRATALSEPGLFGLKGYVFGTEAIAVSYLEAPDVFQDEPFVITATGEESYVLEHPRLSTLEGTVGKTLTHRGSDGLVQVLISKLDGAPGAQFEVTVSSKNTVVRSLQERLRLAEKGRQSGVISATLQDSDPERLSVVLNEIGKQYVRQNVERKAAEAQKTLSFLNEQLPQYRKQQEEAEEAYNRYRNQKGTVAFDEEAKLALGQTVELQGKLFDARQRRRDLQSRFTSNHPTIQTLDAQIAAWSREIESINERVKRMPQIQQDALRMERDVQVNSEMYQSLLNSALQLSLVKEGKVGNVRLLDEAIVPEVPVSPKKPLIVVVATLVGLLLGAVVALLRNKLRSGVSDPHEIETEAGLNVFSSIPLSAEQGRLARNAAMRKPGNHLLTLNSPSDPAIESLRSLRTALQFAMLDAPNNRVLITGATPGVGKSFVSANFAAIMAAGGKRVLLVDADLRKGQINQQLGLHRERGLSELIAGTLSVSDVVHQNVVPGLDVITTGVFPPNPAELLMSESFSKTLNEFSACYDLVVVDTPPVLVAADTSAIAPRAGTVLFVARADKTYMGEILESAKRLAHTGCMINGVIFNAMDTARRRYGSYGGKYGGYKYAQYSYTTDERNS